MNNSLEQSNQKITRIDLWKEAKALSELHLLLNPDSGRTPSRVYESLLKFEADGNTVGRPKETLLHSKADKDT